MKILEDKLKKNKQFYDDLYKKYIDEVSGDA